MLKMISNDLIDKISDIFKKFISIDSKIWNIDTNVSNTWKRFKENLYKNFEFDNFHYKNLQIVAVSHPKPEPNKTDNSYFLVEIDKKNVTPRTGDNSKGWSKSGVRQFLQVGSAFGIIMYSPDDDFSSGLSFNISAKIATLLTGNGWEHLILSSIKNSLFSHAKHINNFGLSLFFAYIIKENKDILKSIHDKLWFKWCKDKSNKKNHCTNKPFDSKDILAISCGEKIYSQTYKDLVTTLLSAFNFDFVINYLYESVANDSNNNYAISDFDDKKYQDNKLRTCSDLEDYTRKIKHFNQKVDKERAKFRQILLSNREITNKEKYCDIELLEEPFITYLDAAHIFEISSIKYEIRHFLKTNLYGLEDVITKITKYASNHNNGLLLPVDVHRAFDRNTFQFDTQGNIIYQKENIEEIRNLGIEKSKIKKCVLNHEMISFLKMRIY